MKKVLILALILFILSIPTYSLNIHREYSNSYSNEIEKAKQETNTYEEYEEYDPFEDLPFLPIQKQTSGDITLPFINQGATFKLPVKSK